MTNKESWIFNLDLFQQTSVVITLWKDLRINWRNLYSHCHLLKEVIACVYGGFWLLSAEGSVALWTLTFCEMSSMFFKLVNSKFPLQCILNTLLLWESTFLSLSLGWHLCFHSCISYVASRCQRVAFLAQLKRVWPARPSKLFTVLQLAGSMLTLPVSEALKRPPGTLGYPSLWQTGAPEGENTWLVEAADLFSLVNKLCQWKTHKQALGEAELKTHPHGTGHYFSRSPLQPDTPLRDCFMI